ncbi:P63C domain-containing protein [Hymenobacter caeli]|uniref:Bacteriophage Mx8 p63 C-terminal domain-containing protein n=1 Tax=Hymenobacter caeli TaxID=2735894 RepID=A0ABX2FQW2_9BACT|nr:P63C domain-containing protein [Hymenobacter caeli]NRT19376.1 hypothetical protein [Hymenobacter caeli]
MKKTTQKPEELSSPATVSTQKPKEVSKQSREQQLLLAGMLILGADEQAKQARELKRKREQTVIELHSGFKITIGEINAIVCGNPSDYLPMFPNNIPFFSEINRLSEVKFDPTEYIKPAFVGEIICEIIYGRYDKSVLPALRAVNPAYINGIRPRKLYHYLTPEGLALLAQYRDEAIEVMKSCNTMYEFRQKLFKQYGVPYQIKAIE